MARDKQVKGRSALRFYHEVLHLDELHAGIWADEAQTLDGLRSAQKRYNERLLAKIPPGVSRILDVGAGTGVIAARLVEQGYQPTGLAPDPYLEKIFRQRTGLPFYCDWFEDLETDQRYDLLLMAESPQYIPLEAIFAKARQLSPGGWLLLADFFVVGESNTELSRRGHRLADFEQAATRHEFIEDYREDITQAVLPTMDLARMLVDRHVTPALKLAREIYGVRHPVLFRLGRWLLRRRSAEWQKSLQLLDSKEFARVKRYLVLRYKIPA